MFIPARYQFVSYYRGVSYCLLAALAMSVMAFFVKVAAPHTTTATIIFCRFSISFLYILAVLSYRRHRGHRIVLRSKKPLLQLCRAVSALMTMGLLYYSLRYISLVDGTVLLMTNPLYIPLLGMLFFKSRITWPTCLSVIVGFIGVLCILKPGMTLFNHYAIYALAAGVTCALAVLFLKQIAAYDDPNTTLLYYFGFTVVVSFLYAQSHWRIDNLHTLYDLVGVGVCGTIYQVFLTKASREVSAFIMSSILYSSVIFSAVIDGVIWGVIPDLISFGGIVITSTACALVIYLSREKSAKSA